MHGEIETSLFLTVADRSDVRILRAVVTLEKPMSTYSLFAAVKPFRYYIPSCEFSADILQQAVAGITIATSRIFRFRYFPASHVHSNFFGSAKRLNIWPQSPAAVGKS